jgi:DNA-binding transcriptional MerR regulator
MEYSLKEVAALLGIAPSTLRKWSEQFDALLSDSVRQAAVTGGQTTQPRYTEADFAILHRAKTLLRSGHTYDQVRRELVGDSLTDESDTSAPMLQLVPSDDPVRASIAPQTADEHAVVEDDETTTAPASLAQAPRSPIDQFRDYLQHARVEDESLRERQQSGMTRVQQWGRALLAPLLSLSRRWRPSGSIVQSDQREEQRRHTLPQEPVKGGSFEPRTPQAGSGLTAVTPEVAPNEIMQAIERIGATYRADLHALRERERFLRLFSYRTIVILVICGSAVLMAIGIVWLGSPRVLIGISGANSAPAASSIPAATHSANSGPLASRSPPALTPTARPSSANTPKASSSVAPSPQPLPTTAPIPTTAPTAIAALPITGSASASDILLQVAEAEAALRMGQIEATITYGAGRRSSAQVRFDLGDAQRVPRFQITTTYEGTTGAQTTERITIGDQAWERQQAGQWTVMPARESALKQLQVFLPRTDSISDGTNVTVKGATVDGTYALHWYDAARDADVTLNVDTAGIPRQLHRVSRANGLVLTVTYSGWNTTVEIPPPAAS